MDVSHVYGNDVPGLEAGSLPVVDGDTETQHRIMRRLPTNPGDYMWHPGYGAGLRRFIGSTDLGEAEAVCVSQILLEDGVAKHPAPTVTLQSEEETLLCAITYVSAITNELKSFSFSIQE